MEGEFEKIMASFYRSPEQILKQLGITEPQEIKIEPIAQYCGATVLYEPLEGCAARIVGNEGQAIIRVDSKCSHGRQRFCVAHELGHWFNDRNRISAFSCTEKVLRFGWDPGNPERKANQYAIELLLPEQMVKPRVTGKDITFDSATDLSNTFQMSTSAAAIRLVELGSYPSMIICCNSKLQRKWFIRAKEMPESIFPTEFPGKRSIAQKLALSAGKQRQATDEVCAGEWFDRNGSERFYVVESSWISPNDVIYSLIWWKDERHLIELYNDDEEGYEE